MTRFSPPLTLAEQAALKTACVELDARRLDRIATLSINEGRNKNFAKEFTEKYFWPKRAHLLEHATAYHLAARTLAQQMAERL